MAARRTTKTEETVETTSVKTPVAQSENLQKQNEMLQKQIQEMQVQMALMMKAMTNTEPAPQAKERNITFVNMVPGTYVLRGSKIWEIKGQFKTLTVLEREARLIVNNMGNAIAKGSLYITDKDFVKENDLEETYRHLLNREQLESMFSADSKEFIEIYKSATESQQKLIVDMIKSKKQDGENVDANILMGIGKLCGENLLRYGEMDEED